MPVGTSIMDGLVTNIGSFFTAILTWLGQLLTMITAQPLLLVFVILAITAVVIRMVRSWIPGRGV